jgi:hypothetical protein
MAKQVANEGPGGNLIEFFDDYFRSIFYGLIQQFCPVGRAH